jgi:hypothetical protein
MFPKRILLAVAALALAAMACSINIDLPFDTEVKTGPTEVEEINIPKPDSKDPAEVTISFGAGELYLSPGAKTDLIEGTATYNVVDLKPKITTRDTKVEISTGNLELNGIPDFDERVINEWDLKLGDSPIELDINAGAYVGEFDLGGLSLTNLEISDGAANVEVSFSEPNQVKMKTLRYETGASDISLRELANANFETMIFQSGAGNFDLDFSGELQDDATVFIESGLSSLTVTIPEGTSATITVESGLTNITTQGSWERTGDEYSTSGEGPSLDITIEMNAGNLILRNR